MQLRCAQALNGTQANPKELNINHFVYIRESSFSRTRHGKSQLSLGSVIAIVPTARDRMAPTHNEQI
jgi:hypothetical protein